MRASALLTVLVAACASAPEHAVISPAPTSAYLDVPGGRLFYEVAGQGTPVVLIHGGFGDRRMWDAQFTEFARSFRVVRYDHRGFGNSPRPDSAYSHIGDLAALLDHLGIAKTHLIGNSMGGGVALDFAVSYPDRVHKAIVVASGANGYPYTQEDNASVVAVFRAAGQQGVDTAARMWRDHPMIAVASKHPRSAALVQQMVVDNRDIFRMEHWPWTRLTPSAYERLPELRIPVLFVLGDQDTPVVQRALESTAARVPGTEIFRMANADHLPQMVDPEGFNRRALAFLAR